ncbi:hypothetical protein NQZ68_003061 [Dissostichus eleginoides]|nr:hypothetical protein NQZ68_003061 [Dissostichus eleginoides]
MFLTPTRRSPRPGSRSGNVSSLPGIRGLAGWQADGTDEDGRDWLIPNLLAAGSQLMAMLGTQRERTVADFPIAIAPIPAHHQLQMSHQQLETFRLMLRFSETKIIHDSRWSQSPPFSQHSSLAVLTGNPPLIIIGIQHHNTPP